MRITNKFTEREFTKPKPEASPFLLLAPVASKELASNQIK